MNWKIIILRRNRFKKYCLWICCFWVSFRYRNLWKFRSHWRVLLRIKFLTSPVIRIKGFIYCMKEYIRWSQAKMCLSLR